MKSLLSLFYVVVLINSTSCNDVGETPPPDLFTATGTVIQDSGSSLLIESDIVVNEHNQIFYPLNLSAPFRQTGLRIKFSGTIEADPATMYLYPPLKIWAIATMESGRTGHQAHLVPTPAVERIVLRIPRWSAGATFTSL